MQNEIIVSLITYSFLIFFSFLLLPRGLYQASHQGRLSFPKWLEGYGVFRMELIFSLACLLFVMIFNAIHMIVPSILSFYSLIAFRHQIQNDQLTIPKNKKMLYAFFMAFGLYLLILNGFTVLGVFEKANTIHDYRLIQLLLLLTITSCYLFKIRLRDFNWSIDAKTLVVVFAVFILLKLSFIVATDLDSLKGLPVDYFFRNFIQHIYHPSLVEEVIFRGFLLSGLLAIGMKEFKANLIQAIAFGLIHALPPNELTLISVLSTSMQMYMGYLIGKLYLSTKSLTPCIILHALIDTI